MKRLFILLVFFLSFSAMAETQQTITSTLDESANCRSVSDTNLSSCANYIVKDNMSLQLIAPLIDGKSAAFATFLINKFGGFNNTVNIESQEKADSVLSMVFNIVWRLGSMVAGILFTWSFLYQIGRAMMNKGDVDSTALGWSIFNQSTAFFLICGGGIFALYIGAIVAGVFTATIRATPTVALLSKSAAFDEAAYYQRAERYAKSASEPLFNKLITMNVGIDTVQTEYLAQDLRRTDMVRIFMRDSAFEKCLANDKDYSDSFFNGNFKDGKATKTQACLMLSGYQVYEPGQLSYSGSEESIQAALIELNKASRRYAYEFRKMACGEALEVDDKRYQLAPDYKAYQSCLNRNENGEVVRIDDKNSVNFLPNSDLDMTGLSNIKTDATAAFAKAFATWAISQKHIAEIDTDLTSETNIFVVMWRISQTQTGYSKWKNNMIVEFQKISSSADVTFSTSNNGLGKIENSANALANTLNGNIQKESKFIDINQSLAVALKETMRPDNGSVMNGLLYVANFVGGNVFDSAGFTGQNCFNLDNTCIAPFSNQIASAAASNIEWAEHIFYIFITSKIGGSFISTFVPDASFSRIMLGSNYILCVLLSFAVVRAVASLLPVFVFMGLITTYVIRAPMMIVLSIVDTLLILIPTDKNLKQHDLNSSLWGVFMTAVWLFIAPMICIGMFFVCIALYGSAVIVLGFIVYEIATHFIGTDGSIVVMIIQFCVMMFVFQLLDLGLMITIVRFCVNVIKVVDKMLSDNSVIEKSADTITRKVNSSVERIMSRIS